MVKYCPAESFCRVTQLDFPLRTDCYRMFMTLMNCSQFSQLFHCLLVVPLCFLCVFSPPCLTARSRTGTTSPASGSEQQLSPTPTSAASRTSAGTTRRRSRKPSKAGEQQQEEEEEREVGLHHHFFNVEVYSPVQLCGFIAYFALSRKGRLQGRSERGENAERVCSGVRQIQPQHV